MAVEGMELPPITRVPDLNNSIPAARGQLLAVRTKRRFDELLLLEPLQGYFGARSRVAQLHVPHPVAIPDPAGQNDAVAVPAYRGLPAEHSYALSVRGQNAGRDQLLACGTVPENRGFMLTQRDQAGPVQAERHGIFRILKGGLRLPRRRVPDG